MTPNSVRPMINFNQGIEEADYTGYGQLTQLSNRKLQNNYNHRVVNPKTNSPKTMTARHSSYNHRLINKLVSDFSRKSSGLKNDVQIVAISN